MKIPVVSPLLRTKPAASFRFILPFFVAILAGKASAALVAVGGGAVGIGGPFYLSSFGITSEQHGNNTLIYNYSADHSSYFISSYAPSSIGSRYYEEDDVDASFSVGHAGGLTFRHAPNPNPAPANNSVFGEENWLAFTDGTHKGWLSFNLDGTGMMTKLNYFLYDDAVTNGIPLSTAISYSASLNGPQVPEFSSGLAIGSVCVIGALCRRSRRRPVLA